MTEATDTPDAVGVLSIPPGVIHDIRSELHHGGGVHRSDLWAGFASSALLPEPAWVDAHAPSFDVAHLHLGLGAMSPVALFHVLVHLRASRKPVVLTVHNLENPCVAQSVLDELLRIAVPIADEIITFTVGAAREILRRWGRVAHIIPHPPVIPGDLLTGPQPRRRGFVVGIDVTRRCGVAESWETVETAVRAVAGLRDTTLRVEIHPALITPGESSYCPDLADRARYLRSRRVLDVRVHEPLGLAEIATYLRELDAFVLSQRRGTHSSWVEACHDVGTTAIVPEHGCFAEQAPCLSFRLSEVDSLELALGRARHSRPSQRTRRNGRAAELEFVALAHRELYLSLIEPQTPASPEVRVLQAKATP